MAEPSALVEPRAETPRPLARHGAVTRDVHGDSCSRAADTPPAAAASARRRSSAPRRRSPSRPGRRPSPRCNAAVPAQAPFQPTKKDFDAGVGVRRTFVPLANGAEHSRGQRCPKGCWSPIPDRLRPRHGQLRPPTLSSEGRGHRLHRVHGHGAARRGTGAVPSPARERRAGVGCLRQRHLGALGERRRTAPRRTSSRRRAGGGAVPVPGAEP